MATPDDLVDDIFQPCGKLRSDAISESTADALREAIRYARTTRWEAVRSPHLFMGLLAAPDRGIHCWGDRLGADLPQLLDQFAELFHQEEGDCEPFLSLNREFLSDNVIRLLREAYLRAGRTIPVGSRPSTCSSVSSRRPIVSSRSASRRIGVTAAKLTELAVIAEQQYEKR